MHIYIDYTTELYRYHIIINNNGIYNGSRFIDMIGLGYCIQLNICLNVHSLMYNVFPLPGNKNKTLDYF